MTFSQKEVLGIITNKSELDNNDLGFCLTVLRDNLTDLPCNDYTYKCLDLIIQKFPK